MKTVSRQTSNNRILNLPSFTLTPRQLCDIELLLNGAFSPLEGFMDEETYMSVVENMKLPTNKVWPIPVIFDTDTPELFKKNNEVVLSDEYGKPIAIFKISDIYKPDKNKEAMKVYGTKNQDHYGVHYLFNTTRNYYVGGKVEELNTIDRFDFKEYRHTPKILKKWFQDNNWKRIIGFQTRNPLHKVHHALLLEAAQQYKGNILLHPSVGLTKYDDIDHITRTRSYIKFYKNYLGNKAKLSLLPLAMRMAGPKEAVWHAIIRKNYGCTHFIIGRDHAGPKDLKGKSFYGPYDAQELVKQYANDIGIVPVPFKEYVYVPQEKKYIQISQLQKHHTPLSISGSELRRKLLSGESIPDWFSFPDILDEIKRGFLRNKRDGITIFFTGLPCSGKSTIAQLLYFRLLEIQDKKISYLDGDLVRHNLSKGLGFSKEDRNINIERIGFVASEITKHSGIAICAAIAPYKKARDENRRRILQIGTYIEVYISTPLALCKKRDVKGLYKKALAGKLKGMTGIDDIYEPPINPEITLDTSKLTKKQCVEIIVKYLEKNRLIIVNKIP